MNGLRGSLKDRMEDKFFGSTARTILSKLSTNEHRIITTIFLASYAMVHMYNVVYYDKQLLPKITAILCDTFLVG